MALTSYLYTQLVTKVRVTKGDSDLGANRARNIPVRASIFGVSRTRCLVAGHLVRYLLHMSTPMSTTKYDSYHMRVPGEHARPGCSVRNYLEHIVWQTHSGDQSGDCSWLILSMTL